MVVVRAHAGRRRCVRAGAIGGETKQVSACRAVYKEAKLKTGEGCMLHDITDSVREMLATSGVREGVVTVTSKHTTLAVTVNEMERRLVDDTRLWLNKIAPPSGPYLHNDISIRMAEDPDCPPDEPLNAHSHLCAMLLGNSEQIAVAEGKLQLGQYQSIIAVELDGPRDRTVAMQVTGMS